MILEFVRALIVTVPFVHISTLFVVQGVVWSIPTLPIIAEPACMVGVLVARETGTALARSCVSVNPQVVTVPLTGTGVARNCVSVSGQDTGCVACQNVPVTGVEGIDAIETGCVVTAGSIIISSLSVLAKEAVLVLYVRVRTLPARVHPYPFLVGS